MKNVFYNSDKLASIWCYTFYTEKDKSILYFPFGILSRFYYEIDEKTKISLKKLITNLWVSLFGMGFLLAITYTSVNAKVLLVGCFSILSVALIWIRKCGLCLSGSTKYVMTHEMVRKVFLANIDNYTYAYIAKRIFLLVIITLLLIVFTYFSYAKYRDGVYDGVDIILTAFMYPVAITGYYITAMIIYMKLIHRKGWTGSHRNGMNGDEK